MTREEAIKKWIIPAIERTWNKKMCKEILKALEQEPCEDATLKDIFCMGCEYKEQEPCEDVVALEFSADIDKPSKYQTKDGKWHDGKIPSVTPKQNWIPVNVMLPEEDGFYLATCDGEICGEDEPVTSMAEFENGKWVDDEDDYQCVLAWMPLPEPYKSENPTSSNCTVCIIDGTDACSRGAGRAVDGRVCEDFVGESEDKE